MHNDNTYLMNFKYWFLFLCIFLSEHVEKLAVGPLALLVSREIFGFSSFNFSILVIIKGPLFWSTHVSCSTKNLPSLKKIKSTFRKFSWNSYTFYSNPVGYSLTIIRIYENIKKPATLDSSHDQNMQTRIEFNIPAFLQTTAFNNINFLKSPLYEDRNAINIWSTREKWILELQKK